MPEQAEQTMLDVLSENMTEGLVMAVLKENNIELSENTFRFHLKVLLEKHEGLFESMIARIGREKVLENLCVVYQELENRAFKFW
jgi:hypothetical protein